MRFEVGYGLEGALPDALAGRIINETIAPLFKQGDFYGGINAGLDQAIRVIDGEPLPAPDRGWKSRAPWRSPWPFLFLLLFFRRVFSRIIGRMRWCRRAGRSARRLPLVDTGGAAVLSAARFIPAALVAAAFRRDFCIHNVVRRRRRPADVGGWWLGRRRIRRRRWIRWRRGWQLRGRRRLGALVVRYAHRQRHSVICSPHSARHAAPFRGPKSCNPSRRRSPRPRRASSGEIRFVVETSLELLGGVGRHEPRDVPCRPSPTCTCGTPSGATAYSSMYWPQTGAWKSSPTGAPPG